MSPQPRDKDGSPVPDFRDVGLKGSFANWVTKRQGIVETIKGLDDQRKDLSSRIEGAMSDCGVKSVVCDEYRVAVIESPGAGIISKEKLLELGVSAKIIELATKRTPYTTVMITRL